MSMSNTEKAVKDIRRKTPRKFATEERIRIVLDGLRGESCIAYALSQGRHQSQFILPRVACHITEQHCHHLWPHNDALRSNTKHPAYAGSGAGSSLA